MLGVDDKGKFNCSHLASTPFLATHDQLLQYKDRCVKRTLPWGLHLEWLFVSSGSQLYTSYDQFSHTQSDTEEPFHTN